jgi:hypothetical protein
MIMKAVSYAMQRFPRCGSRQRIIKESPFMLDREKTLIPLCLEHIHDSTVTTAGQEWTNGLISSFALKSGFTRNLEFMAF